MGRDPLRMYLVLRRGAIAELARAGELAGAAAVACLRVFETQPEYADAIAAWRERPGKVCLRARTAAQWEQVLAEPHALAGEVDGEAVIALPPRLRSQRGPLLERLQAMSSDARAAARGGARAGRRGDLRAQPGGGHELGQDGGPDRPRRGDGGGHRRRSRTWVAAGCPGRVIAPGAARFAALAARGACVARVVDAGLTEVAPGTVTVLALAHS